MKNYLYLLFAVSYQLQGISPLQYYFATIRDGQKEIATAAFFQLNDRQRNNPNTLKPFTEKFGEAPKKPGLSAADLQAMNNAFAAKLASASDKNQLFVELFTLDGQPGKIVIDALSASGAAGKNALKTVGQAMLNTAR